MNRKNGRHFDGFCPALALVLRLGLLYAAWLLCRIVFFLQNRAEIGPLAASELPGLLHGSLVFDTVSILYVNSLFIVLSLVPLRLRERRWYGTMLFWLFSVANALALIVNVSDGVYYHYAKKRFTSDELSYLGNNDNTGTVLLKALAENWYVALFAAGLIAALVWAYRRIRVAPSRIRSNTAYALIHLPALLVAVGLSIGGIQGRIQPTNAPDHAQQRHAVYRVESEGEPDPQQPVLYAADARQPLDRVHRILRRPDARGHLHPDPPAGGRCGRLPCVRRPQYRHFHPGKFQQRTFGAAESPTSIRTGTGTLRSSTR